jgi:2-keto-3-deoxy-L-rhamnonate aldolase RhmA
MIWGRQMPKRRSDMTTRQKNLRPRAVTGELVASAMIFECFTPGIAQIAKNAGAEFVLYDMEHADLSIDTLKMLCATCAGIRVEPMVRVPFWVVSELGS